MRRALLIPLFVLLGCEATVEPPPAIPAKDAGGGTQLDSGVAGPADTGVAGPSDTGVPPMGCEAPRAQCGSRCVNVLTSPDHCGGCNMPCTGGEFCSDGACERSCPGGLTSCGAACVDLATDRDHCGMCNMPCARDRDCRGGTCGCPDGQVECDGACVNPETDPMHCGICNRPCDTREEFCDEGSCECTGGNRETDCTDGDDEDCDNLVDCADPDCVGETRGCMGQCGMGSEICEAGGSWGACEGGDGTAEICGDGIDQDCMGGDERNPDMYEENDTCGTCKFLSADTDPDTMITATFDSINDRVDCFKFRVSDDFNFGFPEDINIRLEDIPTGHDYDVYLYRNDVECVARNPLVSGRNTSNANEDLTWDEVFNSDDSGIFYIRVVRFRGASCTLPGYSLHVNGLN